MDMDGQMRAAEESDEAARKRLREIVREGYNTISHAYRSDASRSNEATDESTAQYQGWVDELAPMLEPGSKILDLGCGNGLPGTMQLVEAGFDVTGLDFSVAQIERARTLVPRATFIEADMATWDCAPGSFDAIVSFYAMIHVPLDDQRVLLLRIRRWLRPNGLLLAIVGHGRYTGFEEYLGAPMFWEHADTAAYLDWLAEAGLVPAWDRFIPEGKSGHSLILARVAANSPS